MLKDQLAKKLEEQKDRITRNILAEKAGISSAYFYQIISGRVKNPGVYTIQKMAKALNCSIDELLGRQKHASLAKKTTDKDEINLTLAKTSLLAAIDALDATKQDADFATFLETAEAIYTYSSGKRSDSTDKSFDSSNTHFAQWFVHYLRRKV